MKFNVFYVIYKWNLFITTFIHFSLQNFLSSVLSRGFVIYDSYWPDFCYLTTTIERKKRSKFDNKYLKNWLVVSNSSWLYFALIISMHITEKSGYTGLSRPQILYTNVEFYEIDAVKLDSGIMTEEGLLLLHRNANQPTIFQRVQKYVLMKVRLS